MLPDDKHVIVESSDIATAEQKGKPQRTIATVALVKANNADRQTGKGQLLLFGPSGAPVVPVSDDVRALHVAALSGEQIVVLYERDRQLVVAQVRGHVINEAAGADDAGPHAKVRARSNKPMKLTRRQGGTEEGAGVVCH